jgi:hypothetical protein
MASVSPAVKHWMGNVHQENEEVWAGALVHHISWLKSFIEESLKIDDLGGPVCLVHVCGTVIKTHVLDRQNRSEKCLDK